DHQASSQDTEDPPGEVHRFRNPRVFGGHSVRGQNRCFSDSARACDPDRLEEAAACSQGRKPLEDKGKRVKALKGRRQASGSAVPSPLRGSLILKELSHRGLAPPATCLGPFGAMEPLESSTPPPRDLP